MNPAGGSAGRAAGGNGAGGINIGPVYGIPIRGGAPNAGGEGGASGSAGNEK
jgi:hypothetical protein